MKKVEYDFTRSGHALCIVDTGSCHADLTDDYADITREMGAVAARFGEKFLRDVDEGAFRAALPQLREECGDRAVLRAMHFFEEDRRAEQEAEALEQGDFDAFLALVDQSGLSSALNLQNTWSAAAPQQQAIPVAPGRGTGAAGRLRRHPGPRRRLCLTPSRPLSPTGSWRPSGGGWRNCWARGCATSCTSGPMAAVWS